MITAGQFRAILLGGALLCMGGRAAADTIVLKNGRRIMALSAVEEGDKVKYLTVAGELSLPKSIVDHIEKGSAMSMGGTAGADGAHFSITPPAMGTSGKIPQGENNAGPQGSTYPGKISKQERAA